MYKNEFRIDYVHNLNVTLGFILEPRQLHLGNLGQSSRERVQRVQLMSMC